MVSSVFSTAAKYGEYGANFLLGTGSSRVGKELGKAILARKRANMSFAKSVGVGFSKGLRRSNMEMIKSGGFFKNIGKTLSSIPKNMSSGWSSGTGFFSKIKGFLKPLGKALPLAMNVLWLASYIPDIVGRTKEEGIWGGIKEAGKALTNMAVVSLACAAAAPFGLAASLIAPMVAGMATNMLLGKPFGQKKAEAEEAQKQEALAQNQNNVQGEKLDIKL